MGLKLCHDFLFFFLPERKRCPDDDGVVRYPFRVEAEMLHRLVIDRGDTGFQNGEGHTRRRDVVVEDIGNTLADGAFIFVLGETVEADHIRMLLEVAAEKRIDRGDALDERDRVVAGGDVLPVAFPDHPGTEINGRLRGMLLLQE